VALSYAVSPVAAIAMLADIEEALDGYQPLHASLADFLDRSGDLQNAEVAYLRAIEMAGEATTKRFLQKKLGSMLSRCHQ
jgi:RNA polymerase sigma-70 factor (ECF subfamily)